MSRISVFLLKETETFDFPIYEGRHIKRRIKYNSKIKKIINILYREAIEIENKFNRCSRLWKIMNIALDLDSFSMSEFCLHQLDILPKQSRRSEQVKGSFGFLAWI